VHGASLWTLNRNDFDDVSDLNLYDPADDGQSPKPRSPAS
jgi:hypothetical protein